jgi:hypothetical protein
MPKENITVSDLKSLYFTTNIKNLRSILEKGILSRTAVQEQGLYDTEHDISNSGVQNRRRSKQFSSPRTGVRRKLHDYANLYIQPNNAFLVVVQKEISRNELCVIRIKPDILEDEENAAVLTTKNAACAKAKFFAPATWAPSPFTSRALTSTRLSGLDSTTWVGPYKFRDSKQSRQSEALVPGKVDPSYFDSILVHNEVVKSIIETILAEMGVTIPVTVHATLFTSPKRGAFSKQLTSQTDPMNPVRLFSQFQTDIDAECPLKINEESASDITESCGRKHKLC